MTTDKQIRKDQIIKIQAMRKRLGWDDDFYHDFLDDFLHPCASTTHLTECEADVLIGVLQEKAIEAGVWQKPNCKYSDLKRSAQYATHKQLRYIEALWANVSRADGLDARRAALNAMLRKRFQTGDLMWLKREDVPRVLGMLHAMNKKVKEQQP